MIMKSINCMLLATAVLTVCSCDFEWLERGTHRNAENLSTLASLLFSLSVHGTANAMFQAFRVDAYARSDAEGKKKPEFGGMEEVRPGVYAIAGFGTVTTRGASIHEGPSSWMIECQDGLHFEIEGEDGVWDVLQTGTEGQEYFRNIDIGKIRSNSTVTLEEMSGFFPVLSIRCVGQYDEGNGYKTTFETGGMTSRWTSEAYAGPTEYSITYSISFDGITDFKFYKGDDCQDWAKMYWGNPYPHFETSQGKAEGYLY